MLINLTRVLALEIADKAATEKVVDSWIPKKDGSRIYSLVFYQFGGDSMARQAVVETVQVEALKQHLGKYVDISVNQKIYDNGNQKLELVGISASK